MNEDVKNLIPSISNGIMTTPRKRPQESKNAIAKISNRIADATFSTINTIGRTVDSLISVFAPQTALNRIQARHVIRSFDAAATDRTAADVDYRRTDADSELRSKRIRIMAVSREEQRNDPGFSNGLRTSADNVIGDDQSEEGIQIFPDTGDENANQIIHDRWKEDKKKIDLNGRWHFTDLMRQAENSWNVSGEVLGIIHEIGALGSDIPFSIEMLEPDQLPTSNETWSSGAYAPFSPMESGGYLLDGIEYDKHWRIVAYNLLEFHPGNEFLFQPLQTRRVPVQRVIHYFEPMRPKQARGVPFACSGLNSIYNSNEMMKSEILASRAQTNFPIHFMQKPGPLPFNSNGGSAPVYDSSGNPVDQIQTLSYTYGDAEPIMLKNERVNSQFIGAMEFEMRRSALAMHMSPSSYAKDSKGLNFSSLREDKMEDRRGYRYKQGAHARYFIEKFWPLYIRALVLKGILEVESIEHFKELCKCEIAMADWGYVNPEQEVKADAYAVAMGKMLPSEMIGKRRWKEHVKKYAIEVDMAENAGLDFAWMQGETPGSKKSENDPNADALGDNPAKKKKVA